MSRIRVSKGKMIDRVSGNINMYSESTITQQSKQLVQSKGDKNGVFYGETEEYIPIKKVVVLFIGGAADKKSYLFFGKNGTHIVYNQVLQPFGTRVIEENLPYQYYIPVYLGYHDVRNIGLINNIENQVIKKIPNKETPVYIVGHSLGGWNGAHLSQILTDKGYKVTLLITLDPVGTTVSPKSTSNTYWSTPQPKADFWINIRSSQETGFDNVIAKTGGRWIPGFEEKREDSSQGFLDKRPVEVNPSNRKKNSRKPDITHITNNSHGEAGSMFEEKIEGGLSASDYLLNSIKKYLE